MESKCTNVRQIFDMSSFNVLVGPNGIKAGDELTVSIPFNLFNHTSYSPSKFFYPSTEWSMAQPFPCNCSTPSCRGTISGAKDMSPKSLEGIWLSAHVRQLLEERDARQAADASSSAAGGLKKVNGVSPKDGVTSRELSGEMGGDTVRV